MNSNGNPVLAMVVILSMAILGIAIAIDAVTIAVVSGLILFICICVAASRFMDRCKKSIEEDD